MRYKTAEEYLREWPEGVSGGKGEGTAKDQLKKQNELQDKAFNLMQDRQNQVSDAVSKYLSGDVGFDPKQLALLKAQFLNKTAQSYNTAGAKVRTALLRSGSLDSSTPPGGDAVRGISALEGGLASDTSSGLASIDIENLKQAITNKFNAGNLVSGQAAQLEGPVSTFGSGANSALNNYVQASNSGFGSSLLRQFGSTLGAGLGFGVTGGLATLGRKLSGTPATAG